MTLRRALFGFIAASCLFLLVEMIDSHEEVKNTVAWLPAVVTSLAAAVGLAAFFQWREQRWRLALLGVGVILIVVGVLGFFLHTGGEFRLSSEEGWRVPTERNGPALYVSSLGAAQGDRAFAREEDEGEEGEEDEDEGKAPPLAPLSLAGVGILGLMAASLEEERTREAALGRG